ncbi:hypothetical protein BDV95DRAFT_95430 [Massariosphaeria phaeospora]|uniref:Uncharacterized protein n=1 Tax=Massariosphaeria phaeospora TaxID=100035 RepID=A0A7C8I2Q3_9PLEO|nr:hypothetical protein BDV95DRAFT_95430 [Massariosphaeria phaeospora]
MLWAGVTVVLLLSRHHHFLMVCFLGVILQYFGVGHIVYRYDFAFVVFTSNHNHILLRIDHACRPRLLYVVTCECTCCSMIRRVFISNNQHCALQDAVSLSN